MGTDASDAVVAQTCGIILFVFAKKAEFLGGKDVLREVFLGIRRQQLNNRWQALTARRTRVNRLAVLDATSLQKVVIVLVLLGRLELFVFKRCGWCEDIVAETYRFLGMAVVRSNSSIATGSFHKGGVLVELGIVNTNGIGNWRCSYIASRATRRAGNFELYVCLMLCY